MSWLELVYGEETGDLISEEVPESETLYKFITSLDERVCPECAVLEGAVFPESVLEETFPGMEVLGEGVIHPHVHFGCRCTFMAEQYTDEYPIWGANLFVGDIDTEISQYNRWAGGGF
jgi:hypothetical protein